MPLRTVTIDLNEYHVANLKSLIEACGYGGKMRQRSPLWVANTGDWLGEVYNLLPEVDHPPNADSIILSERANRFK